MTRHKLTAADRIRAYARTRPTADRLEIAHALKLRPAQVDLALTAGPRGRPRKPARGDCVRASVSLPRELHARAREIAEEEGASLSAWIYGCVIAGVEDTEHRAEARRALGAAASPLDLAPPMPFRDTE
jgi:hypothetical protein